VSGVTKHRTCQNVSFRYAMSEQWLRENKDILRHKGHTKHSCKAARLHLVHSLGDVAVAGTFPQPLRIGA